MWKNLSAATKCKQCGGELVNKLSGLYCPRCDKIDSRRHLDQKIIKPIPKLTYKYNQALHSKQDAQKVKDGVNEDQSLALNSTQQFRKVDRGNQVITTANVFGQDYVNIAIRAEVGLLNSSIPDGSYIPPYQPPYKPPHKNPIPGPGPTPGPGPGPGPNDDEPINPVIPPPEPWYPVPTPQNPETVDCTDVPELTISVVDTTMAPGDGQDITVTGGGGEISMTIDDPGEITDPGGTNDSYITIVDDATNPDCINNITITVSDECGQTASVTIGVNTTNPNSAYLIPGTNSFVTGLDYGSTRQCCDTYQLWQYCDGHTVESSYVCETCQDCTYLLYDPNNCYATAQALCPGSAMCQQVGSTKEELEALGCCVGS